MKKHSTRPQSPNRPSKASESMTIGMDLGDKTSRYCVLNSNGEVVCEATIPMTKAGLARAFGSMKHCRIALEVGGQSGWVSRVLRDFGHEVIVANARQVKLITENSRKNDRLDAELLARLARIDPQLLRPIRHRSPEAQADLMRIRARAALVDNRTALVNAVRGFAKSFGERVPSCDADTLTARTVAGLSPVLQQLLRPMLQQVESLSQAIHAYDEEIEQIARAKYPETALLKQINGVGTLIALTLVLTVEDPERFGKSRDVGCYVGLRPKRSDSGESQPQLRITKEGDVYLRKLLVQGAHCILAHRSPDTDLKRWGLRLAARGGKNARKRAVVAVARKLGILLHRLWVTGEVYEPLRNSVAAGRVQPAA
jgi:transposase